MVCMGIVPSPGACTCMLGLYMVGPFGQVRYLWGAGGMAAIEAAHLEVRAGPDSSLSNLPSGSLRREEALLCSHCHGHCCVFPAVTD